MAEAQQDSQPVFTIEKIYVKDLSLEVPNAPQIFLERDTPQVDVQLSTKASPVDDGHYEVVLTVTTTATLERQDRVSGGSPPGRNLPGAQPAEGKPRSGAVHHLPEHPLPLCARDGVRCDLALRFSAVPAGTGELRGAVPAAPAAAGQGETAPTTH